MRRRKRTEIRRTGSEEKSERRSFESLLHRGLRHPVNLSDSPSDSSTATGESTSIPREIKEIIIATACLFDRAVLNLVESEVEAYDAVKRVLPGRDDAEDRLELVKNIIKEAEKVENADNDEEKRRLPIFQTLRIALSNQGLDSGDSKVCSLVSKVKGKAASFKEEAESGTDSSPEGGG